MSTSLAPGTSVTRAATSPPVHDSAVAKGELPLAAEVEHDRCDGARVLREQVSLERRPQGVRELGCARLCARLGDEVDVDLEVPCADRRLDAVAVAAGVGQCPRDGRLAHAVEAEHPATRRRRPREHGLEGLGSQQLPARGGEARRAGPAGRRDAAVRRVDESWCRARDPDHDRALGHGRLLRDSGRELRVGAPQPLGDRSRDALDVRHEVGVDAQRRSRHTRDELDGAVVVGRAEPARDEADVSLAGRPQCRFEVGGVVTDDRDPLRDEPEGKRLAGVEGAVRVGSLAAHELAARDDDRRARPRAHPLTAVAPATVNRPLGQSEYRVPSTLTTTFLGFSTERYSAFFVKRWNCPFSSVPV